MRDYIYLGSIVFVIIVFVVVVFLQNLKIKKLMNRYEAFMNGKDADIYVYAHATAPFITVDTMKECIEAVQSGKYDSAFCAIKLQDYLWKDGEPLNFDASNVPRTQDLEPIYQETSGVYVFTKEVFEKYHRRIGKKPFIKEVSFKEAVDIDEADDFELAEVLVDIEV